MQATKTMLTFVMLFEVSPLLRLPAMRYASAKKKPYKTYRGNVSKFGNNDYLCIVNKVSKE